MGNKVNYEYTQELDLYLQEIDRYNPLSRREEQELSYKIRMGDKKAKEKLVKHNLKFVVNLAKNYRDRGVPFTDLISEGNIGLMRAADKFDGDKGIKFISYAVWWIKNSFNECIENYKVNKETKVEDYVLTNISNQTKDANDVFEEQLIKLQNRKDSVKELMDCLKEREQKILTLFYGLCSGKEMTLDEVGVEMNLTMERVRQIKNDAITKLKCSVLSMNHEDFNELRSLS